MQDRRPLGRIEQRFMLVIPAHAEVDVLTGAKDLNDLPLFGGLSWQALDFDGIADTRSCRCDRGAHNRLLKDQLDLKETSAEVLTANARSVPGMEARSRAGP